MEREIFSYKRTRVFCQEQDKQAQGRRGATVEVQGRQWGLGGVGHHWGERGELAQGIL